MLDAHHKCDEDRNEKNKKTAADFFEKIYCNCMFFLPQIYAQYRGRILKKKNKKNALFTSI